MSLGEHPLTSQLVMLLRHANGELRFAPNDLERMLDAGRALSPDALLVWLRDLAILAVTLRDDMSASTAGRQVEQTLIDPLVTTLDRHIETETRTDNARRNAKAEQRGSPHAFSKAIQPQATAGGAGLRGRRN